MSLEEQDQIYGALKREERDLRRELVALQTRLEAFGESFGKVNTDLSILFGPFASKPSIEAIMDHVSSMPLREEVGLCLKDYGIVAQRHRAVTQKLREMDA